MNSNLWEGSRVVRVKRRCRSPWRVRTPISSDPAFQRNSYTAKAACVGLLVVWALILSVMDPAANAEMHQTDPAAKAETPQMKTDYEVSLEGVPDKTMEQDLKSMSDTFTLEERPPAGLHGLRARTERDVPKFLDYFQSQGHYGATVHVEIDPNSTPVQVRFNIDAGPVYSLESAELNISRPEPELRKQLPSLEELGLKAGTPAKAETILEAQKSLRRDVRNLGYAFPKLDTPQVLVDHNSKTAKVVLKLNPGLQAQFGDTTISGLEAVKEAVIRDRIPWKEGDLFQEKLPTKLHARLTETGLFGLIEISHPDTLPESGLLPISIRIIERKHRTVGAGVSYKTDEGPGAKVFWEHRNIRQAGEKLRLQAEASGLVLGGEGTFRIPAFRRDNQSLVLSSRVAREDTDAYESLGIQVSAAVERQVTAGLRVSAGPAYRLARIDQMDKREEFALLSFPGLLFWDTSDSILDPTEGGRLAVRLAPFYDMLGVDLGFLKGSIGYSRYVGLWKKPFIQFSGRGLVGFLEGASRDRVPADERFYAGGGGSVRGYPYQTLGPLLDDEPIGGRSVVEVSFELRMKITETIGLVTFLDGGSAFETSFPDFEEPIRWGTGVGLRYYTAVGPLRLDLAFPLDRREGIDDAYQIYVSIGQAF